MQTEFFSLLFLFVCGVTAGPASPFPRGSWCGEDVVPAASPPGQQERWRGCFQGLAPVRRPGDVQQELLMVPYMVGGKGTASTQLALLGHFSSGYRHQPSLQFYIFSLYF